MSRTVDELDQALRAAKERVARALQALKPKLSLKPEGPEMEECRAAFAEQLAGERNLALAKGEETAVREPDPAWAGTYVTMVDPTSKGGEPLAIVEFERCYAHRFGGSNDEVIEGHPLYGKGLEGYRAHEVENSSWRAAEQAINSVHSGYRPEPWARLKHYLLAFQVACSRNSLAAALNLALPDRPRSCARLLFLDPREGESKSTRRFAAETGVAVVAVLG